MTIYIDVSVLTLATFVTGIQRVTREISLRLLDAEDFAVVLLHYNAAEDVYYRIDNQAYAAYYRNGKGRKERMITKKKVPLSEIGAGAVFFDLDAAWMCRMKRSYLLPILKQQGARIVAHIYDIIPITHPQYCLERGIYNFMDFIAAHLQYADRFIVNSHATVDELVKLTEKLGSALPPCSVVPLGADFKSDEVIDDTEVRSEVLTAVKSKPYVLMVGTIEPRKNHRLLVEAYDKGLKEAGYNIIMAGYMGWNMEDFQEQLLNHPDYGQGVYHFEGLNDKEIDYLYQHARCLAFLSYTEGFGLPIIEALQRETQVVAVDIPVLREVGGDACVWFEQGDAEALCRCVQQLKTEKNSDYQTISWKEAAETLKEELLK